MKKYLPIIIVAVASGLIILNKNFVNKLNIQFHPDKTIDSNLKFQLINLLIALISALLINLIYKPAKAFLSVGNLKTTAARELWLGVIGKSTWRITGLYFLVILSAITILYMFIVTGASLGFALFNFTVIQWIIIFAVLNSLSEELIYRYCIVAGLDGQMKKTSILYISAFIFGSLHYSGWPQGVLGVLMAGLLGYILAKATYETRGLGLAWFIHFIQDIIIFSILFMAATS